MIYCAIFALGLGIAFAALWRPAGGLVRLFPTGTFTLNGEYPSAAVEGLAGPRFASWSGSDRGRGELHSAFFRTGFALAFALDGYPIHAGESIVLERVSDHRELDLRPSINPGERWTRQLVLMPRGWIGHVVRFRALDESGTSRGWIGVSDVRAVSLASGLAWIVTPWRLWAGAFLSLVMLLAAFPRMRDAKGRLWRSVSAPAFFLVVVLATVLVFRLPSITHRGSLNPDESQMTAQAITFAHHAIPWLDVDGTTSGPLNSLVVAAPALIGITPTLTTSRTIGALLLFGTLANLYLLLRRIANETAARVTLILPLSFFCGATDHDHLQYASELLPIFLISLASLTIGRIATTSGRRLWSLCVGGAAIGALPFTKLQAVPFAAFLALLASAAVIAAVARSERIRCLIVLGCAMLSVPAIVLTPVVVNGAFSDFLKLYVLFPRTYVASNCCDYVGISFFLSDPSFAAFLLTAIILCGIALCAAVILRPKPEPGHLRDVVIRVGSFFLMAGIAIYAVEAPRTPFRHYLFLLVVPVVGILGTLMGFLIDTWYESNGPRWLLASSLVIIAIASTTPAVQGSLGDVSMAQRNVLVVRPPRDPSVRSLREIIRPNQRVAMWGWMPEYLVYTGALMGTRDSISQFQIEARPFRDYYRARYLADFLKNKPDFMLEAVGPGDFAYSDRETEGLSTFPALWSIVKARYALTFHNDNVRLFERNDLIRARTTTARSH